MSTTTEAAYRLYVDPFGATITRDLRAGISGPWLTATFPVAFPENDTPWDHAEAAAAEWAATHGFRPVGAWEATAYAGHTAELARAGA